METVRTRLVAPTASAIDEAALLLRAGGLVAFPTETVYGLGANALDAAAVDAIFAAKGRPGDNPLIVHVGQTEQAWGFCDWNETAQRLAQTYWPGPLTLVLPKKTMVPDNVTAGLNTVALRMPDHPVALALLQKSQLALAAPSANRSGRPSPTTAQHVLDDLQGLIPLIIDGGPCRVGVESTVVDLSSQIPLLLRPGAVTPEEICAVAGTCRVADSVMRPLRADETAPSPGMRHRHYAPQARLSLVRGQEKAVIQSICRLYDQSPSAAIFAFSGHVPQYGGRRVFDLGRDPRQAAQRLFSLLRQADGEGVERIFCETASEEGLGLALMNRLARAASFDFIDA